MAVRRLEIAMVDHILDILRSARQRKPMYLQSVDIAAADNFLTGFEIGCFACGLEVPVEIRERVTIERGWKWYAELPITEMRDADLTKNRSSMSCSPLRLPRGRSKGDR